MATLFQLPGEPLSDLLAQVAAEEGSANIVPMSHPRKRNAILRRSGCSFFPLLCQDTVWWTEAEDMISVMLGPEAMDAWMKPIHQREPFHGEFTRLLGHRQELFWLVAQQVLARIPSPKARWLWSRPSPSKARAFLAWRAQAMGPDKLQRSLDAMAPPSVDSPRGLLTNFYESLCAARDDLLRLA